MKRTLSLAIFSLAVLSLILACGKEEKRSEEKLYTLAQEAQSLGKSDDAIKYYQEILATYPESENNYKAQFMIGYVYAEQLKDYDRAKEAFSTVIERYPDCDLAESAKWMIENVGQDSLGIEFQEKDEG